MVFFDAGEIEGTVDVEVRLRKERGGMLRGNSLRRWGHGGVNIFGSEIRILAPMSRHCRACTRFSLLVSFCALKATFDRPIKKLQLAVDIVAWSGVVEKVVDEVLRASFHTFILFPNFPHLLPNYCIGFARMLNL